jgi:arachidonate 15-lipoxygenase
VTAAHDRALRRPSRFRIPQLTSPDRRRARAATVAQRRDLYALTPWHPPSEAMWAGTGEWLRFPLPLKLANLPPDEAFSWRKWSQFLRNQSITKVNRALTTLLNPRAPMESYREYARLFEVFRPPTFAAARWRSDLDFAEQRLNGCNPMTLKRCQDLPDDALCRAADDTLSTLAPSWNVQRAHSQGRLFACDYSAVRLLEPVIPIGVAWSAPTALFFAGEDGRLRPLAIRLWPADHSGVNTPVNPHSGPSNWALAKAHFQMADGAYHEAISHLLDTHLIIELIAVCAQRHLHPDHPVSQLLSPHFRDNLAIDALARTSLLNRGGPIDSAIGVGARGALNLVGAVWANWDFQRMALHRDLADRGLDDRDTLPFCWYREDATALATATRQLTRSLVDVWYVDEASLAADWEVQGWAAEVAASTGAALRGFPAQFKSRAELGVTLAEILFRASAQHAAVNNGQYDRYGWPLYSPTSLRVTQANLDLVSGRPIDEREFWRTMPGRDQSFGQLNMARVLSAPTYTSIIRTGDAPAFSPDLEPAAADAVQTYRQRLATVSSSLRRRNAELAMAGEAGYTYLDPYNVSRSIEI